MCNTSSPGRRPRNENDGKSSIIHHHDEVFKHYGSFRKVLNYKKLRKWIDKPTLFSPAFNNVYFEIFARAILRLRFEWRFIFAVQQETLDSDFLFFDNHHDHHLVLRLLNLASFQTPCPAEKVTWNALLIYDRSRISHIKRTASQVSNPLEMQKVVRTRNVQFRFDSECGYLSKI